MNKKWREKKWNERRMTQNRETEPTTNTIKKTQDFIWVDLIRVLWDLKTDQYHLPLNHVLKRNLKHILSALSHIFDMFHSCLCIIIQNRCTIYCIIWGARRNIIVRTVLFCPSNRYPHCALRIICFEKELMMHHQQDYSHYFKWIATTYIFA